MELPELYAKCPDCGHDRWEVEIDHLHCGKCSGVIYFSEIASVIHYGKRPIDQALEETLERPLP
jgi:hypothetical protein